MCCVFISTHEMSLVGTFATIYFFVNYLRGGLHSRQVRLHSQVAEEKVSGSDINLVLFSFSSFSSLVLVFSPRAVLFHYGCEESVQLTWSRRRRALHQRQVQRELDDPRNFVSSSSSEPGSPPPRCQDTEDRVFKRLSFTVGRYLHVEVRVQRVVGSVSATEEVAKTGDQTL